MINLKRAVRNKVNRGRNLSRKYLAEWSRRPHYAKMARDRLDDLLGEHLPSTGTYIEAGALDGFDFSNTYFLDRIKGWSGLLVEPNPLQYAECRRFRKRARVVHSALVPFDFDGATVTITYGHDLSWTEGAYSGTELLQREDMLRKHCLSGEKISVPARTIQSLIEEHSLDVTFFSLDVEGFELQVLQGLDFNRSAPTFLLVECQDDFRYRATRALLGDRYSDGIKLTRHDYLFRLAE